MSGVPDRINIDKKDRELYNKLDQEEILRHKDKGGRRTRKEQFLIAMAIGFRNKIRRPLESKEGWFLIKDLKSEDEALIDSISVYSTHSVDVLSNREEVFRIVEEYAHAGIRLLVDKIFSISHGSFEKQFENELNNMYSEMRLS